MVRRRVLSCTTKNPYGEETAGISHGERILFNSRAFTLTKPSFSSPEDSAPNSFPHPTPSTTTRNRAFIVHRSTLYKHIRHRLQVSLHRSYDDIESSQCIAYNAEHYAPPQYQPPEGASKINPEQDYTAPLPGAPPGDAGRGESSHAAASGALASVNHEHTESDNSEPHGNLPPR